MDIRNSPLYVRRPRDQTFKIIRTVVFGTSLLIESCVSGTHRFSVVATTLFTIAVTLLSFIFMGDNLALSLYYVVIALITLPILFV